MMTKALKGTLAAAAGLALALSGAAAGHAQDGDSGATGTVDSDPGIQLNGHVGDKASNPTAYLLSLDLGDEDLRTVYCIQFNVDLEPGYPHEERPWDKVEVTDLPLVLGILVNGYNGTNAEDLLDAAGVDWDLNGFSADQVAYAGTQSAIWSQTDKWTINPNPKDSENDENSKGSTVGDLSIDKAVTAVQKYLADNSQPIDEPDFEPYFEIDDSAAVAEGSTVGPYTVDTNLDKLTFAQPEGATVVDENGEPITEFTDDLTFYVEFPEAVSATVTLVTDKFTWTTPAGRTFVPVDGDTDVKGQRLILAESHTAEYTADYDFEISVEAVPSESPKPQLPVTGSSLTTVASVGGAVLLAGIVAMVLLRRRRADWGADA